MTYTQNLEVDNLKLREQLQDIVNWVIVEFLPESSLDSNEDTLQGIIERSEQIISSTNRHFIPNQTELFSDSDNNLAVVYESEVSSAVYVIGKRLESNAKSIKSITKNSLILNLKACICIIDELIKDLETKRLCRNEQSGTKF